MQCSFAIILLFIKQIIFFLLLFYLFGVIISSWLEQLTRQVGSFGSGSSSAGNGLANYAKPAEAIGERHTSSTSSSSHIFPDLMSAKPEGATYRSASLGDRSQDQQVFRI